MYTTYKTKIDDVLKKYTEKNAITYMRNSGENTKLSFNEIETYLHCVEENAEEIGLMQGDRVAIISPHSPWAVFTGIALTYVGFTIVLIDASLPQEEIEKLLAFSDVRALYTTETIYARFGEDVTRRIPCFNLDKGFRIESFNINNIDYSASTPTVDSDSEIIAILYSSGTTGQMKGIMVTYESVLKAKEVFVRLSGLKDYMTYLLVLPFNHIAGFTGAMTFFLTGCEIGFIEDVNATKLQSGLLQFQPYYFAMVPKVYEVMEQKIRTAICEKGKSAEMFINTMLKLSGFFRKYFGINIGRTIFKNITKQVFGENIFGIGTGASPCKAETTEFFLNLGLEWANLYATTETSVPIVATGIQDRYPVGTVGNINRHPEIQIQIRNADSDGIGEITVKSELMMKGYFKRPDLTAEAFENDFFKTGDYGFVDKKGYLHITGRIKESIILQNGKKVSPADVDDYYLARIPDYDIASRGIANAEESYDEIHLFIADEDYSDSVKKTILDVFEEVSRSAPDMYKLSGMHFVPSIPRTSVGKVKRFYLTIQNETIMEHDKFIAKSVANITDIVGNFIKQIQGLNMDFPIVGDMRLKEDLGMDSLKVFEMCVVIDEKYNVSIESKLHDGITVAEIIGIIENKSADSETANDVANYPLKRTAKDYKGFDKFIRISRTIWNFEVTGVENINSEENYIFCPNHESHFDGMWIIGSLDDRIKHSICSVAADYLFEKKIYRTGLVRMGGIPVHRSGNTTTALKRAYECISKEGYNLLIHPEGTRTRNGKLGEFKHGAAKLSIESGVKIVPVCINGAYEIFPPHRKTPRLFDWKHFRKYTLKISFGMPIEPGNMTEEQITAKIRQQIVERKRELKG